MNSLAVQAGGDWTAPLIASNRVLVKNQGGVAAHPDNGWWVATAGAWFRATDADTNAEINSGAITPIESGAINADTVWQLTTDGVIVVGVTSLNFSQIGARPSGSIQGSFKNMQASANGVSANISLTAEEIVVENNTTFDYQTLRNVNLTAAGTSVGINGLDAGVLAASTWYSLWVIWNGTTTAALMSLSATAPTMPSGYTHKARTGWIRTDASVNKYPFSFKQLGKSASYIVAPGSNVPAYPVMASGLSTGSTVSVGNFTPLTAARISGNIQAAASQNTGVNANNNGTAPANFAVYANAPASGQSNLGFNFLLETAYPQNIYYISSNSGVLSCHGWEDVI